MIKTPVFDQLLELLEMLAIPAQLIPPHPVAELEQMMVLLESDEKDRPLGLRLSWLEDIVDLGLERLNGSVGLHDSYTLEFHLPIQIQIPSEKRGEVALLCQKFSQGLLFGCIGYMPREGVYFRYCLSLLKREIDAERVADLLTAITEYVHRFSEVLDDLLLDHPLPEFLRSAKESL